MTARAGIVAGLVAWTLALAAPPVRGDGTPPVTLQIREIEAGRFVTEWRVPDQLPARAVPAPILPSGCRPVGEQTLTERPGAMFLRQVWDCPDGLAGESLGIDYPFLNLTVPTVLRLELLSGERHAHSFAPSEGLWRVPEAAGGDARSLYRRAAQGAVAGGAHFVTRGLHWLFLLTLLLLGGARSAVRLGAAFSLAQLAGVAVAALTGLAAPPLTGRSGLAAGIVLLAAQTLRPGGARRQLGALAACAGLAHGLSLTGLLGPPSGGADVSWVHLATAVAGMDAALLLGAALWEALARLVARRSARHERPAAARRAIAYLAGAGAVALLLAVPPERLEAAGGASPALSLPDLPIPPELASRQGAAASRRLTAGLPDAPLQSFLTVAPFEVRHEVLVRLRDVAPDLGLTARARVEIGDLESVANRLRDLLVKRYSLRIDDEMPEPQLTRVDFLTLDERGALPRPEPVAEEVETAWLGLTTVYTTPRTPRRLALTWNDLGPANRLPATVTDPETTRSAELSAHQPTLVWTNELAADPAPVVAALAVDPPRLWLPTVSLLLLALLVGAASSAIRSGRRRLLGPVVRVGVALACLVAPVGAVAIPLPASLAVTPDRAAATRVLSRILPSVYRAFEFPTESAVYDRLALVATGDTLAEIYLEHRRAVELEERGGARARVEAVEVIAVDEVRSGEGGGFVADAVWTVGGTVTHFGHRHFRSNRYDARVSLVPVEGTWKIRAIEVFDEERLR